MNMARTDALAEREKLLTTLRKNNLSTSFIYMDSKDWEDTAEFTMFRVFRLIPPELMIEKSSAEIAKFVGQMLRPKNERVIRTEWPIPSNTTKQWVADFISLGLFEPSKRKHSLKDNEEYWSLTQAGRELHAHIRRLVLEGEEPVSPSTTTAKSDPKPDSKTAVEKK